MFQVSEIGNVFANTGTKRAMEKWGSQLNSACLKGLKISFHRILIVVGSRVSGGGEGFDCVREPFI